MARGRLTPKKKLNPPTPKSRRTVPPVSEPASEDVEPSSDQPATNWKRARIFILISVVAGCLNSYNGYTLFENDCYFSHLSNLEREMTFRTEMGMYYSYFKVLAHAPTITGGIAELLSNNRTEYPKTINTLERFNIYPELVIGIAYRIFNQTVNALGVEARNCWTVTRSEERTAVESCSGLGDPAMFYMTAVYLWNFLSGASIAALAGLLSESILGTLLTCSCYFFNFDESTRIQWTPPLRESFAYPLLIFQILLTTRLIRGRTDTLNCIVYVIITTSCLLCWQFSQFVFVTEISCLFVLFSLHAAIDWCHLQFISSMHLCSMFIAYILMFLNDMLFSSLYTGVAMSCIILCRAHFFNSTKWSWAKVVTQLGGFAMIAVTIKVFLAFILQVDDDDHVWTLLRSKISDYHDFDTMLYTCAPEFDFLKADYVKSLGRTLGFAILMLMGVVARALMRRIPFTPEFVYNFYQCLAFGVMAYTIMRLKLLLTPHVCIVSSVALCPRYFVSKKVRLAAAIGLFAMLIVPGVKTIVDQHSHKGEYTNPNLEELMLFIDDYAEHDESFTGPMPLMANIMLSTGRPIVNHPHYENNAIREKTKQIYTLLSRKPIKEVHENLKKVQARYVVIPRAWCLGKMRTGCSLTGIWDKLDPENRHNPLVCEQLINDETDDLFDTVFQNDDYTMLAIM